MRRKLKKLSDEDLERAALRAMEAIAKALEEEGTELSLGTVVIERTANGGVTVRVEVQVHSSRLSTPSPHEKVARVVDAARRTLERELLEERGPKGGSEQA